jgi:hypothetical protein
MNNFFNVVSMAVGAAIYRDLPDVIDSIRDNDAWYSMTQEQRSLAVKNNTVPVKSHNRRPYFEETEIFVFPQGWGSTALGYGGVGGSAMTSSYTVVVQCENTACVYFGGDRLAYRVWLDKISSVGRENYFTDLQFHNMASVDKSIVRYR